ncbi:MAG: NUDIX pyrophosphatase [Syntrophomonadaceae bacterium]|nr:NUDIX pyrophosphatase [Syntrophomonadaceae bacterium]
MEESHVVTCFIENNFKILLLKRSGRVGSYQQRWAAVSGYIEPGITPLEQARQELKEEVGLGEADVILEKEGVPLEVVDGDLGKKWIVHPFRFRLAGSAKIKTDWEHTECRWVDPDEIRLYDTVPRLDDAWERVR